MKHPLVTLSAAAAAAFMLASQASAGQVVLTPSQDNTLYENALGSLSNGEGQHFFAGRTGQFTDSIRRGLLKFDVAGAVPEGATITSAFLQLRCSRTRAGSEPVSLHRLLADWGEGASDAEGEEGNGAEAQPGDATWQHTFFDTDEWATDGGDFDPVASATRSVFAPGFYTWESTPALVADVQAWLDDPGTDFGWIVIGDEGDSATAKRFDSRENALESNWPRLTIDFTTGPTVVLPSSFTRVRGLPISGVLADLFADDDSRLVSRPDVFRTSAVPPVQTRMVGTSPDLEPSELAVTVESHASVPNILQRVLLLNYDTDAYDQVSVGVLPTSDAVVNVRITSFPERYIHNDTGQMTMLLQYNALAFSIAPTWQARQDRTIWAITP